MIYVFGDFELDAQLFQLRRNGEPVKLEPKIFDVLAHLIRHRDRVVAKDELLDALWPGEFVSDSVLPRCITAVRKALGDTRDKPTAIATVHGRGYRFIAEVAEAAVAAESAVAVAGAGAFVGRVAVMARLRAALDEAAGGRGRLLLLVGEPGIGKTRTAEELAAEARRRGAEVWSARCHEGQGAPAYWPWLQVLRASLRGRDPEAVRRAMGPGRRDIALLLPEIEEAKPADNLAVADEARFQLFDSVTQYLRQAAGAAPLLVLVLDDLHWADGPSLLLLQYLAREMREARLLVAGTYRDVELRRQHPLVAVLGELARESHCERVHLRGLERDDVAHLIQARTGAAAADALARAVHEMTEGNPFFVGEILRLLASDGRLTEGPPEASGVILPQSVREAIGRRLDRLSPECNRVLAVASVIGREFDLSLLRRIVASQSAEPVGDDAPALLERLDEAVSARILNLESQALGRYAFAHALVRQTLYEELSIPQRLHLHAQVAAALEALHAADLDPVVSEIAHHAFESAAGGNAAKAIAYARRAAGLALEQLAYEEAVGHYERILQLLDLDPGAAGALERFEVTLALADALSRGGGRLRSQEFCRRAVAIARSLRRPDLLARAVLVFGQRESGPLPAEELRALLDEAFAALGEDGSSLRSRLLSLMAGTPPYQDSISTRGDLSRQAIALAEKAGDQTALFDGMTARLWSLLGPDDDAERLEAADELVRLAQRAGAGDRVLAAREHRVRTFLAQGDVAASDAEARIYEDLARDLRQPSYLLFGQWYWVARAICDGRFAEGESLARQAFDRGRRIQQPAALGVLLWHVYWSLREKGELGRYQEEFEQTLARTGQTAVPAEPMNLDLRALVSRFNFAGPFVPTTFAYVDREIGNEGQARRLYEDLAGRDFEDVPRDEWWMATLTHHAEMAVAWGDERRARALLRLLAPFADRNACHSLLRTYAGSVAHFLGILAASLRRFEVAEENFEAAAKRNQAMGALPALCRTRLEHARMLLRRGRKADHRRAGGLRHEALAAAQSLGLTGLEAQIRALET